jgi:hypothetical protein
VLEPPSPSQFPPTASGAPKAPYRTNAIATLARGLIAGSIASAAMLGMLLGFGRREGTPWRFLNAAAYAIAGARADGVWGVQFDVTPIGAAVVIIVSLAAGIFVARLAPSQRVWHLVAAVAGVSLAGYFLHLHAGARTPGGLAAILSVGELRALYLAFGVTLFAGMRIAFTSVGRTQMP